MAPSPSVGADPTSTETPAGDFLRIEDAAILRVIIADESHGPEYALTADWLYQRSGTGWTETGTPNDGREILADSGIPEHLFRGDHPPCIADGKGSDIAFETSDDAGVTWTIRASGVNVRPLLADPTLSGTVYGSDCGLAISSDAGLTWTRLDPLPGFPVVDIAIDETRLYVLGVSAMDDARLLAVDLSSPTEPEVGDVVLDAAGLRAIDASEGRVVASGVFGVYVSDDGGINWTASRSGLESVTRSDVRPRQGLTPAADRYGIGVLTIGLFPSNKQRILAGTSSGVYVSQDGGATWVRYDEVSAAEPVLEIQFALDGADLLVTTQSGVVSVPSP